MTRPSAAQTSESDASPAPRQWLPHSWQQHPIVQVPEYADRARLEAVLHWLSAQPALVSIEQIDQLRADLAKVARGQALLLQGGDCAESFAHHAQAAVAASHQTLLDMAHTLSTHKPVVRVARIAGQYAKPRSSSTERIGDVELPSFRGDIINGADFTAEQRAPDPQRMLHAYSQSADTLEWLRALDADNTPTYTSHEALLLPYEAALTRQADDGRWYAGSGHMLWIGDRTRQIDGAHLEYCRGLANPLGVKCGPTMSADELLRILDILDPHHQPGRVTLIVRMNAARVAQQLPTLLRAVQNSRHPVIWSCDPMHGNTISAGSRKTRPYDAIAAEIQQFIAVQSNLGGTVGGLHLEMTGLDVTECIGGPQNLGTDDLGQNYQTLCDPRLNGEQARALAQLTANALNASNAPNNPWQTEQAARACA